MPLIKLMAEPAPGIWCRARLLEASTRSTLRTSSAASPSIPFFRGFRSLGGLRRKNPVADFGLVTQSARSRRNASNRTKTGPKGMEGP